MVPQCIGPYGDGVADELGLQLIGVMLERGLADMGSLIAKPPGERFTHVAGTFRRHVDFIFGSRNMRTQLLNHCRPDVDYVSEYVAEAVAFDLGVVGPAHRYRRLPNSWPPQT
jgi:hypothetical protein